MAETGARVKVLFPEELEEYIRTHKEGSYLLLDVRQPEEYEESHLPGSKLVPLPALTEALPGLDRVKDTIVYCSVGGRSLTAAKFLATRGFSHIFQLEGGIQAWENETAQNPAELHLEFVRGDETPVEAAGIAYRMETGLEQFHRTTFERTDDPELKALLEKLIMAEASHRDRLVKLLKDLGSDLGSVAGIDGPSQENMIEGGLDIKEFLAGNEYYLQSVSGCLGLAMIIETHALDLYLRMADTCTDPGTKDVFFSLGEEEKSHLNALGGLLGEKTGSRKSDDPRA
ncbi:MAG: rhodanese-like domain-containing protein [Syntrophobacter sp.]